MKRKDSGCYLLTEKGEHFFESDFIWNGYVQHWLGKKVCGRYLDEKEYENDKPIILLWPYTKNNPKPCIDIYYNERLVYYPGSILGHIAINVNEKVFNFSYLLYENEVISPEEYLYRPALGKFAPHPLFGRHDTSNKDKPYYDNFGRLFMRTIHVLRIESTDITCSDLSSFFSNAMKVIHETPIQPRRPERYRDFNILNRNCTTLIRDGLREIGFEKIQGITPRDLFINAVYFFLNLQKCGSCKVTVFKMKQLKLPEAPYSAMSLLLNPLNMIKLMKLNRLIKL